ncbi:Heavy-metal resistance [Jannaschia faecimaris]|uniref:Heavy-metal resistance n=1 Tax=Jannaschia faecimaris TaxID=1244108 RepID=A0A1H3REW5_9RHOB|nr:periplasmic heavy metal sensor [Jannaschia faecimaris]SDZ23758.1 Heavy-metal resistance [Jannaschia faecimaris]
MTQDRTSRPWIKWALIASLALNVAIVAAVIGAIAIVGPDRHRASPGRHGGGPPEIAALAQGLDRADRRALFRTLRESGRLAGGRERMGAARVAIAETLMADPFDPAAFEGAMRAQRDLQADLAGRGIAVMSEIIAGLTPAERAVLAERVMETRRERR